MDKGTFTLFWTKLLTILQNKISSATQELNTKIGQKANSADLQSSVQTLENSISTAVEQITALDTLLDEKAAADEVVAISSQLKDSINQITAATARITQLENGQAETDRVLGKYELVLSIDEQSVVVGKSNSSFNVQFSDQRVSFREKGTELAYIDGQGFHTQEMTINVKLNVGSYSFQRMEDGSLGLMIT